MDTEKLDPEHEAQTRARMEAFARFDARQPGSKSSQPGWDPLLLGLCGKIEDILDEPGNEGVSVKWMDCKSKFASLRTSISASTETTALAAAASRKALNELQAEGKLPAPCWELPDAMADRVWESLEKERGISRQEASEQAKLCQAVAAKARKWSACAARLSEMICERCAAPATRGGSGWIVTLCPDCFDAKASDASFSIWQNLKAAPLDPIPDWMWAAGFLTMEREAEEGSEASFGFRRIGRRSSGEDGPLPKVAGWEGPAVEVLRRKLEDSPDKGAGALCWGWPESVARDLANFGASTDARWRGRTPLEWSQAAGAERLARFEKLLLDAACPIRGASEAGSL